MRVTRAKSFPGWGLGERAKGASVRCNCTHIHILVDRRNILNFSIRCYRNILNRQLTVSYALDESFREFRPRGRTREREKIEEEGKEESSFKKIILRATREKVARMGAGQRTRRDKRERRRTRVLVSAILHTNHRSCKSCEREGEIEDVEKAERTRERGREKERERESVRVT